MQPLSISKEKISMFESLYFAIMLLIRKVWKLITRISRQIGIFLTLFALIRKYNAPKKALERSTKAGTKDDYV